MARSAFSPSPSPGFASSRFSDSSLDDEPLQAEMLPSTSRPGSPPNPEGDVANPPPGDTAECQWEECAKRFDRLAALIDHLHHGEFSWHPDTPYHLSLCCVDHIGVHKSNYTCEWSTCPRRGIAQTSRFALISHIRSHTGEKPFVCSKPGRRTSVLYRAIHPM